MMVTTLFRTLAVSMCLAGTACDLSVTQADNPLLGTWCIVAERAAPMPNGAFLWTGFRKLTFAPEAMYTLDQKIPVNYYEREKDILRAYTGLGEIFTFEMFGDDVICVPEFRLHPLWSDSERTETPPGDRIRYERV